MDLLLILHHRAVRYLIVGGEAVIHYGYARLTGDIDLFFESSSENAERLFEALKEFWGGAVPEIDEGNELLEPGVILQFGVPPNRIDQLIENKQASGREKDMDDLRFLREIVKRQPNGSDHPRTE
jgi:hypothetical protein